MNRSLWIAHGILAVAAVLAAAPAGAAEGRKDEAQRETIRANAVSLGARPGPNTGFLIAHIDRYTTDEELARWIEAFRQGGQGALVSVWQKEEPQVGRVRFAETLGRDLRVVRSRPTEKGRRIVLVTDRPLAAPEVMRGLRTEDYPIAWIDVEVDAEGKGEGTLVAAAQLSVDDQGQLVVESFGIQPVKLLNVKIELD